MFRFFCAIVLLVGLGGCATNVETDVEAYSALPENVMGKKFFLAPFKDQDASSLQYRVNAGILSKALTQHGLQVANQRSDADLLAFMGYGIDQGETVTTQYSIPQFGVTGYSGANTYGSVYGNSYSSTTTLTPTYGVTGYSTGTSTDVVYTRSFALDLVNRTTGKKEFEARSVSRGACSSFTGVASEIIAATLSDFPKGKVGKVALPASGAC